MYKILIDTKENNKVSDAIYKSALIKLSILKFYEKQTDIISLEDNTSPSLYSDYCWVGKFVSDYSQVRPTINQDELNTLKWLKNKRIKWKSIIKKEYADPRFVSSKDYCPY